MNCLSEVDTLNKSMPRRILGVFKTLHPVGPAPLWCWGAIKATEDKLVSVPSLKCDYKNYYCKSLSKSCHKVSNEDNIAIIDYYLQIFFFIILFPPQNEVNWIWRLVTASVLHCLPTDDWATGGRWGWWFCSSYCEHSHSRAPVMQPWPVLWGVGVGFQAQCDNEWGREGQNSFWTWPWLVRKLDKFGEGNTQQQEHLIKR